MKNLFTASIEVQFKIRLGVYPLALLKENQC